MSGFLSKKRTAQALSELFGTPVSEGTVAAATRRVSGGLTGFMELVRGRIAASPVVHFDETGFRVEGRLHWLHSASTGKYSLITVHRRRGVTGMDHVGVLPDFAGVAVHDAWAPYDTYTQGRTRCATVICCASCRNVMPISASTTTAKLSIRS